MSEGCSETLNSKLLRWLEKEGYSLEMRVAQMFRQAGFDVSQFETYVDPESDDLREIDVVASISRQVGDSVVVFVTFFIECKYLSKPWVVFVSPRRLSPFFYFSRILEDNYNVLEWKAQASLQGRLLAQMLSSLGRKRISSFTLFAVPQSAGCGLREALGHGKDHAYEAIMQVSKSVEAHDIRVEMDFERAVQGYEERLYESGFGRGAFRLSCSIAFPIIVGKGKLFECCLDLSNEMVVSEAGDSVVLVSSKSHSEESLVSPSSTSVVRIVTEDRLHSFAEEAFQAANSLLSQESAIREWWEYEHRKILGRTEVEEIPF
jgi:hypothetical protein